ncbi:unnamed protein product [Prorocentrum cordatum]|uniref:Kinase n=1 Tax=Prorocentrum cordatum TaxID=2364126 RepID=A0ABN9X1C3_9DINO|nr:unnamed protein product [Polarella glacialis]
MTGPGTHPMIFAMFQIMFAARAERLMSMLGIGGRADETLLEDSHGKNSIWPLAAFEDDTMCPVSCAGVPLGELQSDLDIIPSAQGCQGTPKQHLPDCPREGGSMDTQAGGHADSFYKLTKGRVAKLSEAFESNLKAKHIFRGKVELMSYMEMWCLTKLQRHPPSQDLAEVTQHKLSGFVDDNAFAPSFFGLCKVGTGKQAKVYLVMENLMRDFMKPCNLDLKLGYQTAEPDEMKTMGWMKSIGVKAMARDESSKTPGVRVAGWSIPDAFSGEVVKMGKMDTRPDDFIEKSVSLPGHKWDKALLRSFRERVHDMRAMWLSSGEDTRSVGLSALLVHECGPVGQGLEIAELRIDPDGPGLSMDLPNSLRSPEVFASISFDLPGGIVSNEPKKYKDPYFGASGEYTTRRIAASSKPAFSTAFSLRHQVSVDGTKAPVGKMKVEIVWAGTKQGETKQRVVYGPAGTAEIPIPAAGEHCVDLTDFVEAPRPRVCFTVRAGRITVPAPPVLKLIDYAHFYPVDSERGSQWRDKSDGVGAGLATMERELVKYL